MRIFKNGDKPLKKNDKFLKYYREIDDSSNKLQEIINNKKNCNYFFNEKFSEKDIKFYINLLDFSNVTDMDGMFQNCSDLQTIPELDTSNVTNMTCMFYECHNLQTIPQLNTSKVTDMFSMFGYCYGLQTIPQLNTSKVTKMSNMFNNCENLQTIDITSMDKIANTSDSIYMCYNCLSLTKFIIRNMTVIPPLSSNSFSNCYHFKGMVNSTYNPEGLKDGRIYVPDNMVESLKTATNWSAYADIIVPLSSLEE